MNEVEALRGMFSSIPIMVLDTDTLYKGKNITNEEIFLLCNTVINDVPVLLVTDINEEFHTVGWIDTVYVEDHKRLIVKCYLWQNCIEELMNLSTKKKKKGYYVNCVDGLLDLVRVVGRVKNKTKPLHGFVLQTSSPCPNATNLVHSFNNIWGMCSMV